MHAPYLSQNIPNGFECPITLEVMTDPVIAADGHSYERAGIEAYFRSGQNKSPITRAVFATQNLMPNIALKKAIEDWKAKQARPASPAGAAAAAAAAPAYQLIRRADLSYEAIKANELGRGGFGVVYRGKWTGRPVAIKQLLEGALGAGEQESFRQEAEAMGRLHHPHIMVLYGAVMDAQPYCMVMDLMKMSLFDLLKSDQVLPWSERYRLGCEVGSGLDFLHSQKMVHRDLKSMNVLLDQTNRARLSDFGLARVKQETQAKSYMGAAQGTAGWMAPELLDGDEVSYNTHTDTYAYAMTLWEIAQRKLPFPGKNQGQIIAAVMRGQRPAISETPAVFQQAIEASWVTNPKSRLLPSQIIQRLETEMQAQGWQAIPVSSAEIAAAQAKAKAEAEAVYQPQLAQAEQARRAAQLKALEQAQLLANKEAELEQMRQQMRQMEIVQARPARPAPSPLAAPRPLAAAAAAAFVPAAPAALPKIGDFREGGVVFYLDPAQRRGLVCAVKDLGCFEWGPYNTKTNIQDQALFAGAENTRRLCALDADYDAAQAAAACRDGGKADWHLPSWNELKEMYKQRAAINATAIQQGGQIFYEDREADGKRCVLLSSSEDGGHHARSAHFSGGYEYLGCKDECLSVRPARAFNY
jgi:hypothetical protein